MIKLQIIHFFRQIKSSKLISFINIVGLSVGLACVMMMVMVIIHQLSFDRFHKNTDNIYRVNYGRSSTTNFVLGTTMQNEIPEIESFFRLYKAPGTLIKIKEELINEEDFFMADATIFNVLSFQLKFSDKASVLDSPDKIVLSQSAAKKYFGKKNPVGEILEVNLFGDEKQLTVSGVFEDFPYTSSFIPDFICHIDLSFIPLTNKSKKFSGYAQTLQKYKTDWFNANYNTFILTNANTDLLNITQKLSTYPEKYKLRLKREYNLQSLTKVHLYSDNLLYDLTLKKGDRKLATYCSIISAIILLVACFNLILLSTADTEKRFKEIAVRQVNGATLPQVRRMIINQNILLAAVCFIPAVILAMLSIPYLNLLLGTNLHASQIFEWKFFLSFAGISLITGLLSGTYISFSTGIINLTDLIKGTYKNPKRGKIVFNVLMTIQFVFFIGLGVCSMIISKQIRYSIHKDQGFDTENLLAIPIGANTKITKTLIAELKKSPHISSAAGTVMLPPSIMTTSMKFTDDSGEMFREEGLIIGQDMLTALGVKFIDGEDFPVYNKKNNYNIINELAAKKHNLKVGDIFYKHTIRAIIPDIHLHSTKQAIAPLFIMQFPTYRSNYVVARFNDGNEKEAKELAQKLWSDLNADGPGNSFLLNDQIHELYEKEKKQLSIISSFTLIAILLSSLGLFGFATLAIMRRTKEIGIRKVNGSRTTEIVLMLNKSMVKWIWIAFIIAGSAAYFLMERWLSQFAYKTDMSWWIFALAGILAIGIAMLTVTFQSWRAATQNPVEALRYE